jgi:hypothetical protein
VTLASYNRLYNSILGIKGLSLQHLWKVKERCTIIKDIKENGSLFTSALSCFHFNNLIVALVKLYDEVDTIELGIFKESILVEIN